MKKAIVCGTRFGQFYIEALINMPDVDVVGILASGSYRSRRCANHYNLKLYQTVETLPDDIDFACVIVKSEIMGGAGVKIAQKLMEKGIDVIFEQPININEVVQCFQISQKYNKKFALGNLYTKLPAVENFITNAQILIEETDPLFINVDFATQVSYPLMEILDRIIPLDSATTVKGKIINANPFQVVIVEENGLEIVYRGHNEVDYKEADGYLHLFFQICIGFPGGRLILIDPHGPVIWQPRVRFPKEDLIPFSLKSNAPESMKESNVYYLYDVNDSQQKIFTEIWPDTIREDIEEFFNLICCEDKKSEAKRIQKQLLRCRKWRDLMYHFGYPMIIEKNKYSYISNRILQRECTDKEFDVQVGLRVLNKACCFTMLFYLQNNIEKISPLKAYQVKKLIDDLDIQSKFENIIFRWIKFLHEEQYILSNEKECYFDTGKIDWESVLRVWEEARAKWSEKLGTKAIFQYFFENAKQLGRIMNGEVNPTWLLFPEGRFDIATELYSETAIAKELNHVIAQNINAIAQGKEVTVLELGAGTGATTQEIYKKFGCLNANYIFSDLSEFFLSNARDKFGKQSRMRFEKIDIDNVLIDVKKISVTYIDIIVAVGVINNAKNILKTMKDINKLLQEDGYVFLVEAVGESAPMLISQAFMMQETNDERKEGNLTFLLIEQWYDIFAKSGFKVIDRFPDGNSCLTMFNQRLFVLQKEKEYV